MVEQCALDNGRTTFGCLLAGLPESNLEFVEFRTGPVGPPSQPALRSSRTRASSVQMRPEVPPTVPRLYWVGPWDIGYFP